MDKKQLIITVIAAIIGALIKEIIGLFASWIKELPAGSIKNKILALTKPPIEDLIQSAILASVTGYFLYRLVKSSEPLTRFEVFSIAVGTVFTWHFVERFFMNMGATFRMYLIKPKSGVEQPVIEIKQPTSRRNKQVKL